MAKPKYPKEFLELCASVTGKRPKTVIDHILKHGHITTEELKNKYGYDHPPRAARDVRELGIQLETFRVEAANGRKIAAYRFADPTKKQFRRFSGRTGLSKKIKEQLIKKYGCRCFIYLEKMDAANLQIDHRVPYEVAGESCRTQAGRFHAALRFREPREILVVRTLRELEKQEGQKYLPVVLLGLPGKLQSCGDAANPAD